MFRLACARVVALIGSVACLWFASGAAADVVVTIQSPMANALAADSLNFSFTVTSLYEDAQVRAQVGDRSLTLSPGARFGTIGLVGEPRGAKTLVVTVTDAMGATGSASVSFLVDRPPVVTITEPRLQESVAHSTLRVVASCVDDDPGGCATLSVAPLSLQGTSAIDQTVSLARADGDDIALAVTGTDSSGQSATVRRTVYVQVGAKLIPILSSAREVSSTRTARARSSSATTRRAYTSRPPAAVRRSSTSLRWSSPKRRWSTMEPSSRRLWQAARVAFGAGTEHSSI
jgi:hypothetical protein